MWGTDDRVAAVIERYRSGLAGRYEEREVSAIVRTIFNERLGWDRAQMEIRKDERLNGSDLLGVCGPLEQLMRGEPLQYVLGVVDFHGLRIKVDRSALIPRPETEEMVDLISREMTGAPAFIVDVGTGSGCIALALKQRYPSAHVVGIDAFDDTLDLAMANAALNGLSVEWRKEDVLDDGWRLPRVDLVVSNPPYIPIDEARDLSAQVVDHEPHRALFVPGEDALLFYRAIQQQAKQALQDGGSLWFEGHHRTVPDVAELLRTEGWSTVRAIDDLSGNPRFIHAIR